MSNSFLKDPSAVLDWVFDWSSWLAAGETIASHVITVDTGIVKGSSTDADGKVTVWLSGGTAGTSYRVACKITTSAARTDERTVWIQVSDR
jgi:TRAP-type uncharacterized transport system substrate-binding protein